MIRRWLSSIGGLRGAGRRTNVALLAGPHRCRADRRPGLRRRHANSRQARNGGPWPVWARCRIARALEVGDRSTRSGPASRKPRAGRADRSLHHFRPRRGVRWIRRDVATQSDAGTRRVCRASRTAARLAPPASPPATPAPPRFVTPHAAAYRSLGCRRCRDLRHARGHRSPGRIGICEQNRNRVPSPQPGRRSGNDVAFRSGPDALQPITASMSPEKS